MQRNVWSDTANWRTEQLNSHTKSQFHASMTTTSKKKKWNLLENRQILTSIFLKCLYLARIGRPDIPWSVNKLARSVTKWTRGCDRRLARLISYIHHTSEFKQYCHVGNTARRCLFQDSDFAGDLQDSKSISGGLLFKFVSHTFVPISWTCKKQTSTVQRKLRLFLLMQVYAWMGFQLLIFGIWLLKCSILLPTK